MLEPKIDASQTDIGQELTIEDRPYTPGRFAYRSQPPDTTWIVVGIVLIVCTTIAFGFARPEIAARLHEAFASIR